MNTIFRIVKETKNNIIKINSEIQINATQFFGLDYRETNLNSGQNPGNAYIMGIPEVVLCRLVIFWPYFLI